MRWVALRCGMLRRFAAYRKTPQLTATQHVWCERTFTHRRARLVMRLVTIRGYTELVRNQPGGGVA